MFTFDTHITLWQVPEKLCVAELTLQCQTDVRTIFLHKGEMSHSGIFISREYTFFKSVL